ncbi:phosphohydrolase [Capnocytophaga catalasegens]|uniref:Phosphohydrolase n=1 Tax=Capnocytophaga catalasegens TaxID=1004260 RepID=A0AAV5AVZ6_9FLAO|nr:phosphohydrolase [Capnocytophaga catalasegens]GIZ15507.1 hypothetical protein RCZ03_15070 [Capnocytophaga catalasegens]GJM49850.1 hypothetical protein RCZ15_08250 [Capnocytophaga catalasegens]GJM54022.1 hypothetical protein RCZ16_23380 [Capnocytophaga catalasegens]
MINKALNIAIEAHKGQTDKAGMPYIFHLLRVSEKGQTETEKICGLLHDIVEDTEWTFDKLKQEGFSDKIVSVIKCITKRNGEIYMDFIKRVSKNPIATRIKINDLEDNMDIKRLSFLTEKDLERLNKYIRAYHFLKSKKM